MKKEKWKVSIYKKGKCIELGTIKVDPKMEWEASELSFTCED